MKKTILTLTLGLSSLSTATVFIDDEVSGIRNSVVVESTLAFRGDSDSRQIHNLLDGTKDDDATNLRQVKRMVGETYQEIDKIKKAGNTGVSSVAAMSNIPQVINGGDHALGVGVGHYEGQSAVALGYSLASDNSKHIIKISTGVNSQKKVAMGAGYSYIFN